MVIFIAGGSHTGKTVLAQKFLEKYGYPYLSIDHLKMGLIRSGMTMLTPESDDGELTALLWPVVREMVKTAIENDQNLVVEGCYIPFGWQNDFEEDYLRHIRCRWLVMDEEYIRRNFSAIRAHANDVEKRLDDSGLSDESMIEENLQNLHLCREHGCDVLLISGEYSVTPESFLAQ